MPKTTALNPEQKLAKQKAAWHKKTWPKGAPADTRFSASQKKHQDKIAFAMGLKGHFEFHRLDLAGIQSELLMMKALLKDYKPAKIALALLLALLSALPLRAAEDPYKGWSSAQFVAEIRRLQQQVAELKQSSGVAIPVVTADLTLDDFEKAGDSTVGGQWWAGTHDGAGSTIAPDPFVHSEGGYNSKFCGRVHGYLGKKEPKFAWVAFNLSLPDPDIRGYKALRFWVKGDGHTHSVRFEKMNVRDYAHFEASFVAPSEWTEVTIPFSEFKQPHWGKPVTAKFDDVNKVAYFPSAFDSEYDFSIDAVTLIR